MNNNPALGYALQGHCFPSIGCLGGQKVDRISVFIFTLK
jgi:hypothetical protein